jgi:aminoglycoside phosphotransferase (APT) family kinase protein
LLPEEVRRFLKDSGLGDPVRAIPLAGGVSSEIWEVELPGGRVCVKRALPRLRVRQVWEAPVERNAYEYEWFRAAALAAPHAVPRVLAQGHGAFAMEYLPPEQYPVWKARLRDGNAEPAFASQVGAILARIHAATAGREDVARRFATDDFFYALRLEPYLVATGHRHPVLKPALDALAKTTAATRRCLVHGDVSPKNILAGPRGPVFLDAECAWYGDPAFDLAFCLNHLLLKCLWNRGAAPAFLACFDSLKDRYMAMVTWEGTVAFEQRTAALLPALLLARVDGKSPVEYVTEDAQKDIVRNVASALLLRPAARLEDVRDAWQRSLP